MAVPDPPDPDGQLRLQCQALNEARVAYVVFGSHATRLHGAALEPDDVDLVPNAGGTNLARLCDALNGLRPRWRVPGFPGGSRSTEAASNRAISKADSIAVGLVASIGNIDVVLQPHGFEAGYPALSAHAVRMSVGGVEVHVGGLDDLIVSKRLLRRPEDLDQLPALEEPRDHLRSTGTELADQGSFPEPDSGPPSVAPDRDPPGSRLRATIDLRLTPASPRSCKAASAIAPAARTWSSHGRPGRPAPRPLAGIAHSMLCPLRARTHLGATRESGAPI